MEVSSDQSPQMRTSGQSESSCAEARAIVVSSMYSDKEMSREIGREAYSYRFVYQAFAPLLNRWGKTAEVTRAESRLDYALWQQRQEKLAPIHLSFLPLHLAYLTQLAPNVVFPFWEFPDLPDRHFNNNLRNNWVRMAEHFALILTACRFTRDAFIRAGVTTPVRVVPVPIAEDYFSVPAWRPEQQVRLDCTCYALPEANATAQASSSPWLPVRHAGLNLQSRLRSIYKSYIVPRMSPYLDKYLTLTTRALATMRAAYHEDTQVSCPAQSCLDLSGVVYTTIFNPYDPRKNWQDLLSAFLLALGDKEDATLVAKLVVCPKLAPAALNGILHHYRRLGIQHRCKVKFVTDYLSDAQMVQLAAGSTYYLNTAKAEGACLPLQSYLAAGRPGIAPDHTAMADYFNRHIGLVVASNPEPAYWPHDPEQRLSTRWNRLVWQSLCDQIVAGYELAKADTEMYQAMARRGRERMTDYASADAVWPRLAEALDSVAENRIARHEPAAHRVSKPHRLAS